MRKPSPNQQEVKVLLKKRALLLCDWIADEGKRAEIDKKLKGIDERVRQLQEHHRARKLEIASDAGFEKICLSITENMHKDAKRMNVMEYYAALDILHQRSEDFEKDKAKRKHR